MIVLNPKTAPPVAGVVVGRDGASYKVRTRAGRIITATSGDTWSIGAQVFVLGGVIVGLAGRPRTIKTYEV